MEGMTAHNIIHFSKLKLGVWEKNYAVSDVKFVRFFMPGIVKNVTSLPCGAEGLTSPYITVLPRSQVAWAGAASVRQTFFFSLSKLKPRRAARNSFVLGAGLEAAAFVLDHGRRRGCPNHRQMHDAQM